MRLREIPIIVVLAAMLAFVVATAAVKMGKLDPRWLPTISIPEVVPSAYALTTHGGTTHGLKTYVAGPSYQAAQSWVSGVTAYYTAEGESTGGAAVDSSGHGYNMADTASTPRNGTTYRQGAQSLGTFNGTSQYVSNCDTGMMPQSASAQPFTLSGWAYETADNARSAFSATANSHGVRMVRDSTNDAVTCGFSQGTRVDSNSAASTFPINTWVHIACVFDAAEANEVRVYINGALSGTPADKATWDGVGACVSIGASGVGGTPAAFMQGVVDSVVVHNGVAWTEAEDCRAMNCEMDALKCMCDGTDPTLYLACSTDNDCRQGGNTTAKCDTSRTRAGAASGTCAGLNYCTGTMAACNAAVPS